MWEETYGENQNKMGLTGLNVLRGVVSSVLSSSAVLCGLHCDWLQRGVAAQLVY